MDFYPGGCLADILALLLIMVILVVVGSFGLLLFLGFLAFFLIAGCAELGGRLWGRNGAIAMGWIATLALAGGLVYGLLQ